MEPEWLGLTFLLLTLFTQKKLPPMLAQSAWPRCSAVILDGLHEARWALRGGVMATVGCTVRWRARDWGVCAWWGEESICGHATGTCCLPRFLS